MEGRSKSYMKDGFMLIVLHFLASLCISQTETLYILPSTEDFVCDPDSAECIIDVTFLCGGECSDRVYHCPSNPNTCSHCQLSCNGHSNSCQNVTLYTYYCQQVTIFTDDSSSELHKDMTVYGPINGSLNMTVTNPGRGSLEGVDIYANNTKNVDITIKNDGSNQPSSSVAEGLVIHGQNIQQSLSLACDTDCGAMTMYCPMSDDTNCTFNSNSNNSVCDGTVIYTNQYIDEGLEINCNDDYSHNCDSVTINCNYNNIYQNYSSQCTYLYNNFLWECETQTTNDGCMAPTPTVSPTNYPSSLTPSMTPSAVPSIVPTFNPTGIPTVAPSNTDTNMPTNVPTHMPTTMPPYIYTSSNTDENILENTNTNGNTNTTAENGDDGNPVSGTNSVSHTATSTEGNSVTQTTISRTESTTTMTEVILQTQITNDDVVRNSNDQAYIIVISILFVIIVFLVVLSICLFSFFHRYKIKLRQKQSGDTKADNRGNGNLYHKDNRNGDANETDLIMSTNELYFHHLTQSHDLGMRPVDSVSTMSAKDIAFSFMRSQSSSPHSPMSPHTGSQSIVVKLPQIPQPHQQQQQQQQGQQGQQGQEPLQQLPQQPNVSHQNLYDYAPTKGGTTSPMLSSNENSAEGGCANDEGTVTTRRRVTISRKNTNNNNNKNNSKQNNNNKMNNSENNNNNNNDKNGNCNDIDANVNDIMDSKDDVVEYNHNHQISTDDINFIFNEDIDYNNINEAQMYANEAGIRIVQENEACAVSPPPLGFVSKLQMMDHISNSKKLSADDCEFSSVHYRGGKSEELYEPVFYDATKTLKGNENSLYSYESAIQQQTVAKNGESSEMYSTSKYTSSKYTSSKYTTSKYSTDSNENDNDNDNDNDNNQGANDINNGVNNNNHVLKNKSISVPKYDEYESDDSDHHNSSVRRYSYKDVTPPQD